MIDQVSKIFFDAVQNSVSVQSQIEFSLADEIPSNDKISFTGDIGGFMSIKSDTAACFISISFPKKTFLAVVSSMLGEEYSEILPELEETIVGILEVTFGNASPLLKQSNLSFSKIDQGIAKNFSFLKEKSDSIKSKITNFSSDKGNFTFGVFLK